MAADIDVNSFQNWEEVFAYPIPVVRKIDQQLHNELDTNKERLRTLVGQVTSYRDLLGTAERIMEMDTQMRAVESVLVDTGRKCNVQAIHKLERNYDGWIEGVNAKERQEFAQLSQLAILQASPRILSRLLREDSSTLLAAKVLVIARLAHKALSVSPDTLPLADILRDQLARLRRKLLRRIDQLFANLDVPASSLIGAMCAFSLATSSSAKDVLRHFHGARLEAIKTVFETDTSVRDENVVVLGLKLYTRTLQDTPSLSPARLSAALSRLKTHPLLSDPQIQSLADLNLPLHGKWLGSDLRNFTPWVRHDDLTTSEAAGQLKAWAKEAITAILSGLGSKLDRVNDFPALVSIRTQILEQWFSGRSQASRSSIPTLDALPDLRKAINARLTALADQRASELELVSDAIASTLAQWKPGVSDQVASLWDDDLMTMDISDGATTFKATIQDRMVGRNSTLQSVLDQWQSWSTSIASATAAVKSMRAIHWDEDSDSDSEDSSSDSDQSTTPKHDTKSDILTKTDPFLLTTALTTSLTTTFNLFSKSLSSLPADPITPSKILFLLRLHTHLTHLLSTSPLPGLPSTLSAPSQLYTALASTPILTTPLETYEAALRVQIKEKRVRARALWEGKPELPVLPSVGLYRFLGELVEAMGSFGGDIWGGRAVGALRERVRERLGGVLQEGEEGEESSNGEGDEEREEWKVQVLFDGLLLERVFGDGMDLGRLKGVVGEKEGEGLEKSVWEYWGRTRLLFGLLA
ncbi:MAG: hypothetical protein M1814_003556 [Vezdaea aestivalis]|nr:MAG: hypothetical protein M1814_003556 [Vezdaea aestivalis]